MIHLVGGPDAFSQKFLADVGPLFLRKWLKYQEGAYRDAVTAAMDYKRPEGRDLLGHLRRARCEEALASAAEEAGLTCFVRKNRRKNYSHRVVIARRFVLVQCHHAHAGEVVRRADHREDYATLDQGNLFKDFDLPYPASEMEFAILQHGEVPKMPSRVGYSVANFPNVDVDRYLGSFDLFKHFDHELRDGETRVPGEIVIHPKRQAETEGDAN